VAFVVHPRRDGRLDLAEAEFARLLDDVHAR
jgi:hypothetical protein